MSLHATNPEAVLRLQQSLVGKPRPCVLLIEDSTNDSELQAITITKLGMLPLCVRTVAEAWEALRLTAVDMILLDLALPGGDSAQMIRDLKTRKPNVPIVVLTGMVANSPFMERAVESGADIIYIKPLTLEELSALTGIPIPP
jgi:DNA-binding response OmpR family regulator